MSAAVHAAIHVPEYRILPSCASEPAAGVAPASSASTRTSAAIRRIFSEAGSEAANSTMRWSRNGGRTSTACAMLMRSALHQNVVRQIVVLVEAEERRQIVFAGRQLVQLFEAWRRANLAGPYSAAPSSVFPRTFRSNRRAPARRSAANLRRSASACNPAQSFRRRPANASGLPVRTDHAARESP